MPKKPVTCTKKCCIEIAEIQGLCRTHYDEKVEERLLSSLAVETLHNNVHAHRLTDQSLNQELIKLRQRWTVACHSVNYGRVDRVLKDEASAAVEWCIALAKELILADKALASGKPVSSTLDYTRDWVGSRFSNLDSGLKSNGVTRS